MTDKLYTQSQVDALLQAANEAALRDALSQVWDDWNAPIGDLASPYVAGTIADRITRLIPQPSALARHDKELVERHLDHLVSMEGWMSPERVIQHNEQLKAEFAAVMESDKNDFLHIMEYWNGNYNSMALGDALTEMQDCAEKAIERLSATPTDYASALDRRLDEARLEEAERIYTNWNVYDRDFDKWLENYMAEFRRAVKGESNAKE
jgi:hypothetical protein